MKPSLTSQQYFVGSKVMMMVRMMNDDNVVDVSFFVMGRKA